MIEQFMFVGIFFFAFFSDFCFFVLFFFYFFNARSIIPMQLKDDSRAMSNSRPLSYLARRSSNAKSPTQRRGSGNHARVQYITWEVEHGFVSRCLVDLDLDLDPGSRSRSDIQTNMTPQGENKEEMGSPLNISCRFWVSIGSIGPNNLQLQVEGECIPFMTWEDVRGE